MIIVTAEAILDRIVMSTSTGMLSLVGMRCMQLPRYDTQLTIAPCVLAEICVKPAEPENDCESCEDDAERDCQDSEACIADIESSIR